MLRVRTDDNVQVITGDDRGKVGKVIRVITHKGKVVVEGVNVVFKHLKRSTKHPQGGRIQKEAPIDASNVMPVCDKCNKPVRVKVVTNDKGIKIRACRKCGSPVGSSGK